MEKDNKNGVRSTIRVGIIGLGRATIFEHLPVLKELREFFSVTAICDLLKERRDLVEVDFPKAKHYRRVEDMLQDPDVDLVLIATPSTEHVNQTILSLQHNKWTLVESPLALSLDDAMKLRAVAVKVRNKLLPFSRGAFSPEFALAKKAFIDKRLGEVYDIIIRRHDYIRRDDWETVKRCGGGAAYYACPDLVMQGLHLLQAPATQLWSELRRIASSGDVEDYAHIILKSRLPVTVDIEYSGAQLPPYADVFTIRGERGSAAIALDGDHYTLHVIDPNQHLPRRRASVRTPDLDDRHEDLKIVDLKVELENKDHYGLKALWMAINETVRTAKPFPVDIDTVIESIKIVQLAKKASPFVK